MCGKELQYASLKRHIERHHPETIPTLYTCPLVGSTGIYVLDTVVKGKHNACPVPGCVGGGRDKFSMYRHFSYRHPHDEIVVSDDGVLPKCDRCGMRVPDLDTH